MVKSPQKWMDQVWSELATVSGISDFIGSELERWQNFMGLSTLEVVVFGAYGSGKSSLLKRLLVDWEKPIPNSLTISGGRETFEVDRILADGIAFLDTPGFSSGNSEHDALTVDAMRMADAFLWVLPPQLVTSGKEHFLDLVCGEVGIASSTIGVIAQMDEAGVDPSDNESGFIDLCDRKQKELISLLKSDSPDQLHAILCVAADPYQIVGNLASPDRSNYDGGRNWDGISALSDTILNLKTRASELRELAGIRFLRLLLGDVVRLIQSLSEELALKKEGLSKEIERHSLFEQRLNALKRQAIAELHRKIEDALLSASRAGGETGTDSIRSLQKSLSQVVDAWSDESFASYRKLSLELEREVQEQMIKPSMEAFFKLASEEEDQEARNKVPRLDPVKTGKKVLEYGPKLRKAFEQYSRIELGMTLKEASSRLQKLESSGKTVEEFISSQGQRLTFKGLKHAEKASKYVKWASALDTFGPIVEGLSGVILDIGKEVQDSKKADERAKRRSDLRGQLRVEAEKFEKLVAADFESTCEGLHTWILQRKDALKSGHGSLVDELKGLEESTDSLKKLYQNYT